MIKRNLYGYFGAAILVLAFTSLAAAASFKIKPDDWSNTIAAVVLNDRLYTIKQVDERSERLIAAILRQMGGAEL